MTGAEPTTSRFLFGSDGRQPQVLLETVVGFDQAVGQLSRFLFLPRPFGITWLDEIFSGGNHPGDLNLLLGRSNVGKTIFVMQLARHQARWAVQNQYPLIPYVISYEHDDWSLFSRLLCIESWHVAQEGEGAPLYYGLINQAVQDVLSLAGEDQAADMVGFLDQVVKRLPPTARTAYLRIMEYASHLGIYAASRQHTTVELIDKISQFTEEQYGLYPMPIVDYLQTMPTPQELWTSPVQADINTVVGFNLKLLKDLAKRRHLPVFAVSSVERESLKGARPIHLEDADGPQAIPYTLDGGIVLNKDSSNRVGRNTEKWIRVSVEKNRNHGPSEIEYRHVIHGGSFMIEEKGILVDEDDSFQNERIRNSHQPVRSR
jgi:replicative DNA helicase